MQVALSLSSPVRPGSTPSSTVADSGVRHTRLHFRSGAVDVHTVEVMGSSPVVPTGKCLVNGERHSSACAFRHCDSGEDPREWLSRQSLGSPLRPRRRLVGRRSGSARTTTSLWTSGRWGRRRRTGRWGWATTGSTGSSAGRPTTGIRIWPRTTTTSISRTCPKTATTCRRISPIMR